MKNLKRNFILAITAMYLSIHITNGQATTPNNTWAGGANEYLGWDNGSATPLQIKTEQSQNINFYTNAGPATYLNQRMVIRGGTGRVGIGTNLTNPQARLDIKETSGTLPTLRLTNSNTLFTDFTVTNTGELTIFAQNSGALTNVLVGDPSFGLPLSALDVRNFSMNASSANALRVYAIPAANSGYGIATYTEVTGSAGAAVPTYGLFSLSQTAPFQGTGIYGEGRSGSSKAVGGYFRAGLSDNNYGVFATVDNAPGANNWGVYGQATSGSSSQIINNYGVYGFASGTIPGPNEYGVYGKVVGTSSGGTITNYAGWFQGDVWITGVGFINGGTSIVSDENYKTDITPIDNAQEILSQLHPVHYYYDTTQFQFMNFPPKKQYGLIAQDVELILPDLVSDAKYPAQYDTLGNMLSDSMPVKALNYTELIPYLIAGYQIQDSKIQDLQNQINDLQTQLDGCCGLGMRPDNKNGNGTSDQTVELKSSQSNFLGESVPNPHASQCSIPYRIDPSVAKAEIVFSDQLGTELSRVEIIARGTGQLTVLSSQLEDGIYTYSLIADGKLIDTKKMIQQH